MGQGCGQEESKSGCFKSAKLIKVTVRLIVPQRKYIVRRFLEARREAFVAAWDFLLCSVHALFFLHVAGEKPAFARKIETVVFFSSGKRRQNRQLSSG